MLDNQSSFGKKTEALAVIALILASAAVAGQSLLLTPTASAATCENLNITGVSAIGHEGRNEPDNVIDNRLTSRWSHLGAGSWITADLGEQKIVCSVDIAWYKGSTRVNDFSIAVSEDGSSYDTVYTGKSSGDTLTAEKYLFAETTARYVKVTFDDSSDGLWASITEIDIYGYSTTITAPPEEEDTTVPSVGITSPADDSTVISATGRITVQGTASDNVQVDRVEVRVNDGSYVRATPRAPGDWSSWSVIVDLGSSGNHRIVPRATDSAGNQAWNSINVDAVVDSAAPSVSISSPSSGSTVPAGAVAIQGTASDSGSGVSKVEVRLGSGQYVAVTPRAAGDWSTWTASLEASSGDHTIYARATDKAGNSRESSATIRAGSGGSTADTTSPSVQIQQPAANSQVTVTGGTITITGTASDSQSGIRIVEVRVDSGAYKAATPRAPGDWSSWSVTLPITAGERRLVPRATDNAGNQAWNSIYVTVTTGSTSPPPPPSGGDGTLDPFGIEKLYPTKQGGNEWYVNMNDPDSDPLFRNLPAMTRQSDGSWQVNGGSRGQVRMEAWSPSGEKWINIEITEYAKIVGGTNHLLQMYSRGGHHTSSNECLGSAYKARLYGDGEARWVKEVTHPAYTGNRGSVQATDNPLEDRWIGFKAVIYNFVENGKTYVRMESYIDDDVTDANGNLVIKNNWKLASVVEDRGGWSTNDSDFRTDCAPLNKDSTSQYRQRDEILNAGGGTSSQNIAAWRSDDLTWNWKYLSVREIIPPV